MFVIDMRFSVHYYSPTAISLPKSDAGKLPTPSKCCSREKLPGGSLVRYGTMPYDELVHGEKAEIQQYLVAAFRFAKYQRDSCDLRV